MADSSQGNLIRKDLADGFLRLPSTDQIPESLECTGGDEAIMTWQLEKGK